MRCVLLPPGPPPPNFAPAGGVLTIFDLADGVVAAGAWICAVLHRVDPGAPGGLLHDWLGRRGAMGAQGREGLMSRKRQPGNRPLRRRKGGGLRRRKRMWQRF